MTASASPVQRHEQPEQGYVGRVACCGEPMTELRPRHVTPTVPSVPFFTGVFTDAAGGSWRMLACGTCGATRMVADA